MIKKYVIAFSLLPEVFLFLFWKKNNSSDTKEALFQ